MTLELYGTPACPYTAELREELAWQERDYIEYDVEADPRARARMHALTGGAAVPVLVEGDRVLQVGYHGRSCSVAPA